MYTTQSLIKKTAEASEGLLPGLFKGFIKAYQPPTTKKKGVLALYGIYSSKSMGIVPSRKLKLTMEKSTCLVGQPAISTAIFQ